MSTIEDRISGVLYGLAAGDRIGGPIAMAMCLSESLLTRRIFDLSDILDRYLVWWTESGFDTGPIAAQFLNGFHVACHVKMRPLPFMGQLLDRQPDVTRRIAFHQ